MCFHPPKDAVQELYRLPNVRAFIQHHALGSLAHRGVYDFRPRGPPLLGEVLQHLGRGNQRGQD